MSFNLEIKGLDALMQRIHDAPDTIKSIIDAELSAGAHDIEADAKRMAPVDNGTLKNGISASGSNLNYQIESNAEYSAFVEFGTGHKVSIPADFETYATQFKGANQNHPGIKAQPFMIPALMKNSPLIIQRIEKELNKI